MSQPGRRASRRQRRAFTLIELVLVGLIITMLASMAIPRIAQGSSRAQASTLRGDLAVLRKAILMYAAEHNNEFPDSSDEQVTAQLTMYTDVSGVTSATRSGLFRFGPYLAAIPALPCGKQAGSSAILIDKDNSPPQPNVSVSAGWVYNPTTGEIVPNTTEMPDGSPMLGGTPSGDVSDVGDSLGVGAANVSDPKSDGK